MTASPATARSPRSDLSSRLRRLLCSGVFAAPGALALVWISIAARLPVAMRSILLLVHTQRLTGSFAAAGVVGAAYTVGRGVGGPMIGKLVDRRGHTTILVSTAIASGVLLGSLAVLPASSPLFVLTAVATAIGFVTPPVNGCLRALLPSVVRDADKLPAAYAFESTAMELTFIFGPPLALGLAAAFSTGLALLVSGLIMLTGTVAFAWQPASREWRPAPETPRRRGGALRSPSLRTLVLALLAVGVVFGATEVGVTAAAKALGSTGSAGPLLALWGVGSLIGGAVATRLGGGARSGAGLALILAVLATGHLLLAGATGSVVAMGAVLVLAGAAISPAYATIYAFVDRSTPAETITEAFSWLGTAVSVGTSAGTALGGSLAQGAGPASAFLLAGGAGALAVLVTLLRGQTVGGASAVLPLRRALLGERLHALAKVLACKAGLA
jgi:MFS family permease